MMILLTETELHHAPALASTTTLTSSEPAINPMAQFFGKKVARKFAIVRVKETEKDAQVRLVKTHKKPNTGTLPDEVMLARTARYNEELVSAGIMFVSRWSAGGALNACTRGQTLIKPDAVLPPRAIARSREVYAESIAVAPNDRAEVHAGVAVDSEPEISRKYPTAINV
ncbi:MAG TPA: hypothetical protein VH933_15710 [Aestuariivirgaceae bacterium]|jgi:hypothetical protein